MSKINISTRPQTSDALSSLIASFRATTTTTTLKSVNTSNPTYLSALSVLASLSSAREATITKVTPHVSTTLNPTKTSASTTTGVTGSNEQFVESQTSMSSTSVAGAVAGQRGVLLGRGTWEQMMKFGVGARGLVLGLVGIF
jgi:carbohydrate-binding DOMON domain-containing protein